MATRLTDTGVPASCRAIAAAARRSASRRTIAARSADQIIRRRLTRARYSRTPTALADESGRRLPRLRLLLALRDAGHRSPPRAPRMNASAPLIVPAAPDASARSRPLRGTGRTPKERLRSDASATAASPSRRSDVPGSTPPRARTRAARLSRSRRRAVPPRRRDAPQAFGPNAPQ
jgi:hypothetical protein